jgi:hypothetical protein
MIDGGGGGGRLLVCGRVKGRRDEIGSAGPNFLVLNFTRQI